MKNLEFYISNTFYKKKINIPFKEVEKVIFSGFPDYVLFQIVSIILSTIMLYIVFFKFGLATFCLKQLEYYEGSIKKS